MGRDQHADNLRVVGVSLGYLAHRFLTGCAVDFGKSGAMLRDGPRVTGRHRLYNKLFTKILDSSIWLAPDPHRLVWITLIAAMDEDGNAMFACVDNLAARARVSVKQAEIAVAAFEAPDPKSGDPENEGRRIERIPGGWLVLNAHKYRAMVTKAISRERTRARTAAWRERKKESVTLGDAPVTPGDASVTPRDDAVTPSEALSESTSEAEKSGATRRESEPDWQSVENLALEAWLIWIAYRRKMKIKSYVDTRMAKRLAAYPLDVQVTAIEESMTQGYAGLFPEKVQRGANQSAAGGGAETPYERAGRRLREWAAERGIDTTLLDRR
jgi:hypothetical protein